MLMRSKTLSATISIVIIGTAANVVTAAGRPTPPARDPHGPGFVEAKELPDGENAPVDSEGNFIIGAEHPRAP
jgi:hypothetical protein